MWKNVFILKMEQQEKEPAKVCVKLVTPAFVHCTSCRNAFRHVKGLMFFAMFYLYLSLHTHVMNLQKDTPVVSSDKPNVTV